MSDLLYGRQPVVEALRSGVPVERVVLASGLRPAPILEEIRELAGRRGVPLIEEERARLSALSGGRSHQGALAYVEPYRYATLDELLLRDPPARLVLLDGVTDPANLGSILRSAEAFGFSGVLVPRRRGVGVTPAVRKVASGAAERVPVARVGSAAECVLRLRKKEVLVVGLDPGAATQYDRLDYGSGNLCLVLGAEGRGLSRLVRCRCDHVVRIPMSGAMASVNVAVAAALVMVEVTRSRGLDNGYNE